MEIKNKRFEYRPEYIVCRQISTYLKLQYPSVMFHYDLTGLGLTKAQAGMNKAIQDGNKWPDLFIAEMKHGHIGLYLEIKPSGTKLYKKDGSTYISDHLAGQAWMLAKLRLIGYVANFAIGFDEAKNYIDWYLKENKPDLIKKTGNGL